MNNTESLGWGVVSGLLGVVISILLYFLYFKKKNVNLAYFVLGIFMPTIIVMIVAGTIVGFETFLFPTQQIFNLIIP